VEMVGTDREVLVVNSTVVVVQVEMVEMAGW
jgi:hypothetical protein